VDLKNTAAKVEFDVLFVDCVIPDQQLFDELRRFRDKYRQPAILLLLANDHDYYLTEAVRVGAVGVLRGGISPGELVDAIRGAARGENLITGEQVTRILSWWERVEIRWKRLSERERQVFALLLRGRSTQDIATTLTVAKTTVETHIGNILSKLGVASRAEAVAWAWQNLGSFRN
jgi:DNA-binding NarL/FixJ family response regulator